MTTFSYVGQRNKIVPCGEIDAYVLFPKAFGGVNRRVFLNDSHGAFIGRDFLKINVYELLAHWNRPYLQPFVERNRAYGNEFIADLIEAFMISDEAVEKFVKERVGEKHPDSVTDWIRHIGMCITVTEEDERSLKYPFRICETDEPYEKFRSPSYTV